jgi:predicted nucleotidyltransferase
MGSNSSPAPGLGDVLFGKTQRKVLGLLFGNPERSYYTNEIVRFAGAGIGAVQRELQRLERTGLVVTSKVGVQKHYQANLQAPIYGELHGIVVKTFGIADPLRQALALLAGRIHAAFIYGSVARGTDAAGSDIDLMIVSDKVTFSDALRALSPVEQRVGRPVKPSIFRLREWRDGLAEDGGFLQRVMGQPKIFLIGSPDELDSLGQPGPHRQAEEGRGQPRRVRRTR